MKLSGQVAIVTGGASGFGKAICELYAKEGAKVLVADINGQGAREVARAIGKQAHHMAVDVANKKDVDAMVAEAVKTFGGLDIMVNNAGYTHKNQPMLNVTEEEFDRIFAVNVKSIYLAALACVPEMEKRGGGVIINTASTAGLRPRPGLTWYNGSKGAAITLTKSMAGELGPKKIRVCAICPVIGETGMLELFMGKPDTPENRARFLATIPLGRFSKPDDVANAALFLASPESSMITGVALEVDGGRCV
ncbi:MAG TPA: SDR family oxidoreductase [Hyphomicrobiaceae bacterium]|nr:SDR family oxidoreductase [Hyphomicrobiaceae bacterium]